VVPTYEASQPAPSALSHRAPCPRPGQPAVRSLRESASNTGDKLRSSIACAGFVCFIPLFGGAVVQCTDHDTRALETALQPVRESRLGTSQRSPA
jgi:hypothetical protein